MDHMATQAGSCRTRCTLRIIFQAAFLKFLTQISPRTADPLNRSTTSAPTKLGAPRVLFIAALVHLSCTSRSFTALRRAWYLAAAAAALASFAFALCSCRACAATSRAIPYAVRWPPWPGARRLSSDLIERRLGARTACAPLRTRASTCLCPRACCRGCWARAAPPVLARRAASSSNLPSLPYSSTCTSRPPSQLVGLHEIEHCDRRPSRRWRSLGLSFFSARCPKRTRCSPAA